MIKLSIIIPVYNVELYVDECVQSIVNQTGENYEIILVDDGSTDKSGNICDYYSHKYNDIVKVIHKENGGLSSARTEGLKHSNGLYVAFVDSDDRLSKGSLPGILNWIDDTEADLCFMNAIKFYEDGSTQSLGDCIRRDDLRGLNKENVIRYLSGRPKYPGSACTKLYKRSFLSEKDISFPVDKRTSEDLGFVLDCIINADSYDALDFPYYEYRQGRTGSITNSNVLKAFWDHAIFIAESINKVNRLDGDNRTVFMPLMAFVAYEYSMMLYMYSQLSNNDKDKAYKFLKEYKTVLQHGKTKKMNAIRLSCCLLGIRITTSLLDVYMRNRL